MLGVTRVPVGVRLVAIPVTHDRHPMCRAVSVGAVLTSLSLVGSVDVDAGVHDVGIRCAAVLASTNAGVSFQNAALNVTVVPL